MIAGIRGRLISASFTVDVLPELLPGHAAPASFLRALEGWADRSQAVLGPASSVRAITDVAVVPLLALLDLTVSERRDTPNECLLQTAHGGGRGPRVLVTGWNVSLSTAWRAGVLGSIASDYRWCFCCNGTALRLVDGHRTWSRDYLEFDCRLLGREQESATLLWTVARGETLATHPPLLDRLVNRSEQHGVSIRTALGAGVLQALGVLLAALRTRRRSAAPNELLEHSLTVVYRVLFLLFAEARGLVPLWHPVYRDRYSLEEIVHTLLAGRRYRGLWHAVLAISRLAHAGCSAGELRVTAFNGRLFAPAQAASFDRTPLSDDTMKETLLAVSTTAASRRRPRLRIAYRDLDVEQLGAVYEHVLDYEPTASPATPLARAGDLRKSTGTFYTPRSLTGYLVRATLEPLVRGRSAEDILQLRVLDPAMGSGAFLVAACRYLASAVEQALITEGRWHAHDITGGDRALIRREVAARCLYGVDLNPMAVQLGRLSIWLATLAADKPLSFLDHHLMAGNSLIGATPADVRRQPSGGAGRSRRQGPLPLFEAADLVDNLGEAARVRAGLGRRADDSAAIVREKERAIAALHSRDTLLGRWSRVLDLWCAGWFWTQGAAPERAVFAQLCEHILGDAGALPQHLAHALLKRAEAVALEHRFFHWPLSFPEVFSDSTGTTLGFDAVIGNPPWDMIRGDSGASDVRQERKQKARSIAGFVRESGIYHVTARAHVNRYHLFVERALQLARPGGRIGFVLPSSIVTDAGTSPLRRHLFERAAVDSITGMDNKAAIFPVHRSVRFVLLTCTTGQPTSSIACRFGITRTDDLDRVESSAADPDSWPVSDAPSTRSAPLVLTRRFLERVSGQDDLAIPEMTTVMDLRVLERLSARVPWLGSPNGWNARFGRELNASDDRHAFVPRGRVRVARPVLEGKYIEPFRVLIEQATHELPANTAAAARVPRYARLAYRDVASATNRLTLIAAIIPASAVTTHTLFCLKTPVPDEQQEVLCALLNSFVANYLVRLRVNTHVTAALMSRLPVPYVQISHPQFARLAFLTRALTAGPAPLETMPEYVELQALVAHLYGLASEELCHVLGTFPLIDAGLKKRIIATMDSLR